MSQAPERNRQSARISYTPKSTKWVNESKRLHVLLGLNGMELLRDYRIQDLQYVRKVLNSLPDRPEGVEYTITPVTDVLA